MSKSRSFKKISSIVLAIVMTISCLSTVLVANAGNTIGWKSLGLTEDKTYDTAGAVETIGTPVAGTSTNLVFAGIVNLGSKDAGQVKLGFGGVDESKGFTMQGNADGSVYLKWNSKVIKYINKAGVEGGAMLEDAVTNVDLILIVKLAFAATDSTNSSGSVEVTLKDATTNKELYADTFEGKTIATADLIANAWAFTRRNPGETGTITVKVADVTLDSGDDNTGNTGNTGNTQTPSTGNTNKVPATGDFTSAQTLVYVMVISTLVILAAGMNIYSRRTKEQ